MWSNFGVNLGINGIVWKEVAGDLPTQVEDLTH